MRRKAPSKEKPIENQILTWLRLKGVFAWKNQSTGIFDPRKGIFRKSNNPFHINGVSDILGVWHGRPLAIEVKSETGRVSDAQKEFITRFREAGGIAFIARSIEDVKLALDYAAPDSPGFSDSLKDERFDGPGTLISKNTTTTTTKKKQRGKPHGRDPGANIS
jgi:hypothetical protein